MKASEKLILMLDLNNYNIDNLFLKKQIESEKTGNLDLHKCNRYSELIICDYLHEHNEDYTRSNPFSYKNDLWGEVKSLDQLIIKHPDVGKKLSIKDFLSIEIFSGNEKRNILNDVTDNWLEEYKKARTKSLNNLQELFFITTKDKNNYYRKPRKIAIIIGLLLSLFNIVLFIRPQMLQFGLDSSFTNYIDSWNQLLHDNPLYSVFGAFTILMFTLYTYKNYSLTRRIRSIVKEKTSNVLKRIYKWETELNKVISKQSKKLKKYVDLVLKKPERSSFELKKLNDQSALLVKYRTYVKKVERKYYWINKNYSVKIKRLRIIYFSFILCDVVFIALAYAIIRGLINV